MTKTDNKSFNKTLRNLLNAPPKPRTSAPLKAGDYFLFYDDRCVIAHETSKSEDGTITADLYQNLDDYRSGAVMEHDFTYQL